MWVRKTKTAAIFLRRATFSLVSRVGRNIGFGFRAEIGVKRLRFRGGAPPRGQLLDPHDTDSAGLREGQGHARAKGERWLGDMCSVHAHLPARNQLCRQPARLEKTRVPEPLVDTLGLAQEFLSLRPIKACANGLSGSIAFSLRGGRASKLRGFCPPSPFGLGLPLPFGFPF